MAYINLLNPSTTLPLWGNLTRRDDCKAPPRSSTQTLEIKIINKQREEGQAQDVNNLTVKPCQPEQLSTQSNLLKDSKEDATYGAIGLLLAHLNN